MLRLAHVATQCVCVAVATLLASCGDHTLPSAAAPLPALTDQRWQVHTVNERPVPALLDTRQDGGLQVQQYLDSSRIDIAASGHWVKTAWVQQFNGDSYAGTTVISERGQWQATATAYVFLDSSNTVRFVMPAAVAGEWPLSVRLAEQRTASRVVLRRGPAPLTVAGRWRAATLNGQPLPAVYRTRELTSAGGPAVTREIVVDSSFVTLQPNARYTQELYYSEWELLGSGGPRRSLYQEVHVDFGQWSGMTGAGLRLESAWVPARRLSGPAWEGGGAALRLLHGIGAADAAATFEYRR